MSTTNNEDVPVGELNVPILVDSKKTKKNGEPRKDKETIGKTILRPMTREIYRLREEKKFYKRNNLDGSALDEKIAELFFTLGEKVFSHTLSTMTLEDLGAESED